MAIQTRTLYDTPGVHIEYDYDDAALRLTQVRVVNRTDTAGGDILPHSIYVEARRASGGGQTYSATYAPGSHTINVGTGGNNRLGITILPNGRVDGVTWRVLDPAP